MISGARDSLWIVTVVPISATGGQDISLQWKQASLFSWASPCQYHLYYIKRATPSAHILIFAISQGLWLWYKLIHFFLAWGGRSHMCLYAQGLHLSLHAGITSGRLREPYGMFGVKPGPALCKANCTIIRIQWTFTSPCLLLPNCLLMVLSWVLFLNQKMTVIKDK